MYLAWAIFGQIWTVAVLAYAFWRGGAAERYGAAICAVSWCGSFLLIDHRGPYPGPWVFIIDLATFICLVVASLKYRKIWILFASACQLNAVLANMIWFQFHLSPWSYIATLGLWSVYGLFIALAGGLISVEVERSKARRAALSDGGASHR